MSETQSNADSPIAKRTQSVATQANDKTVWQEYRDLLSGRGGDVVRRYIADRYPGAAERGGLQYFHFNVLPFVLDVAANAFALRPTVNLIGTEDAQGNVIRAPSTTGNQRALQTLRGWRQVFHSAWRQRFAAGLAVLHLRWTGDSTNPYQLEVLCGDEIEIFPDPWHPLDWQRATKARVSREAGQLTYTRLETGEYRIDYTPNDILAGETQTLGTVPTLPLFGWYRTVSREILPPADAALRDLHVSAALQMSTTEFHRTYRLNQPIITGATAREREIDIGADLIWYLNEQARASVLQTADLSRDGLDYVITSIKLGLRLAGVPPSVFGVGNSDAETGIAKAWDQRDLLACEERDRAAADESVAALITAWLPILGSDWAQVELTTTAPADPIPADRSQYAAGIRAEMMLGLTTPAIELAKRLKISANSAQKRIDKNLGYNAPFLADPTTTGGNSGQI